MDQDTVDALAPTGVLRAGVNLSNFLLVTGKGAAGEPQGVSPDMAAALAERLGVGVRYVTFARPAALADAAGDDVWDVGLIGAEPQRARSIEFSAPYVEIEANYLVPAGSTLRSADEVDRPGVRIGYARGSAYGLWLERNVAHASLVPCGSIREAAEHFAAEGLEALAGLRSGLRGDLASLPGARILEPPFTKVQQAIGVRRGRPAAADFVRAFVEEAKASGLVASLLERHGVTDRLKVAEVAPARD